MTTSHTPPEDRQARLSGAGEGILAEGEISPLMHTVHIQARLKFAQPCKFQTYRYQVIIAQHLLFCKSFLKKI